MDPTTADLVRRVTKSFADLGGAELVGMYPFGSIAFGDYVLGTSDVDLMAVIGGTIDDHTAAAELWTDLARASAPAAGLEVVVVSADHAAHPANPPVVEMKLGTFEGRAWAMEITGPGQSDDSGPNLAQAIILQTGSRFSGPPPEGVFGPVPRRCLLDACVGELTWWSSRPEITGHPIRVRTAVLNACRARRYAIEGTLCSKRQGGEWALHRGDTPHREAIRNALALQAGGTADLPDDHAIRELIAQALQDVSTASADADVATPGP